MMSLPLTANSTPPTHLSATGYDRHVELEWAAGKQTATSIQLFIARSMAEIFLRFGIQAPGLNRYEDFLGKSGEHAQYKIAAEDWRFKPSAFSDVASATTRELSDDELLTMLQKACFHYYWEAADPHSGMARENIPGDDRIVATGASGFAIMSLIVGVDRGFITREQGVERVTKIVNFLEHADRYHGVWSHYMNGGTGKTMPVFGMTDNGGDMVETSFLMQGLLAARQYFKGPTPGEQALYGRITKLWETVEWDWYRETPKSNFLYWHWSPQWAWQIHHPLDWVQRSDDYLSTQHRLANAWRSGEHVLLRLGWAGGDGATLSRRLVGE